MSSSSESSEGFRSRDKEAKQKHRIRKSPFPQSKEIEVRRSKIDENYKGISIPYVKKESSGESLDMFADQINDKATERGKNGNVTDEAGYYSVTNGTIVGSKWKIIEKIGKGVYGVVVKAERIQESLNDQTKEVALKIIRRNPLMQASGQKQYKILMQFKKSKNVVHILDYFHESNHLFLVSQLMGMDLRTFTHRNQSKVTLKMMRQFAIGMFMSLHELRKREIIHADIKPDNFLYSRDETNVKLGDFGTAYKVQEHDFDVDELVARYYRPPEIILGKVMPLKHLFGIDTWGVGCSLFQLYTGKFLFEGCNNAEMLRLMMEVKGRFTAKFLKGCKHAYKYFNEQGQFLGDKIGGRDLLSLLRRDEEGINHFKDLLQRCLMLNAAHRITPEEAFQHPFILYQVKLE